jgi:hypothetical protein
MKTMWKVKRCHHNPQNSIFHKKITRFETVYIGAKITIIDVLF